MQLNIDLPYGAARLVIQIEESRETEGELIERLVRFESTPERCRWNDLAPSTTSLSGVIQPV